MKQLNLIKEIYMGIVVKELKRMQVISFKGFAPEPEKKASEKMYQWLKENYRENKPYRIFGHNIDLQGNLSFDPENVGYKFMVAFEEKADITQLSDKEVIEPGKFIVTGIEGNITSDGKWIQEGWGRLNKMIKDGNYRIRKPVRWLEEQLEPSKPGNLRLDLYLEIE